MTDEEAERYFGNGLVIFGQKRPQPSSESSATPESGSATEADPMQPAVDAIEEWGRRTFREGLIWAPPGSQVTSACSR
jgi:hypothetical protein